MKTCSNLELNIEMSLGGLIFQINKKIFLSLKVGFLIDLERLYLTNNSTYLKSAHVSRNI